MKILIIEDEKPAVENITQMVKEYDSQMDILDSIGSIKEAVHWLNNDKQPDLILLDIQLSDGISLEIFKQCQVNCPVIFTTAYDDHILEAFDYNCIDYLLKPIKQEKLNKALDKYLKLKGHFTQNFMALFDDLNTSKSATSRWRKRITVKKGIDFQSVEAGDIAFFYTEYKLVFLITHTGNKFVVDKPLSDLENELNPDEFFRINRKYLASISGIAKFRPYDKGRLEVELNPGVREEIVVSQEKAASFKKWIDR